MSSAPEDPSPRRLKLRLFLVLLVHLTAFGMAIPLVPALCKTFGGDAVDAGLVFTLQALGQLISATAWGRLSDRWGRRPVLIMTLALAALVDLATGACGSLTALFAVRFTAGLLAGTIATASAYIADVTPIEERSKGMALIGIGFGLGFTIGPALVFVTGSLSSAQVGLFGLGVPFAFAAGFNLIAAAIAAVALQEPVAAAAARRARRELFRGHAAPIASLIRRPGVSRLMGFLLCYAVAIAVLESTLFYYMSEEYGFDRRQIGLLFAAMGLLGALTQGGAVGRLSKAWGDRAMTLLGAAALAVGLCVATLWEVLAFLIPWLALASIGRALAQPGSLALMSAEAAGPEESGALMGLVQSANSAGRLIGPLLGGWLFAHVSTRAPFFTAGAIMALGAIGFALQSRGEAPSPQCDKTPRSR